MCGKCVIKGNGYGKEMILDVICLFVTLETFTLLHMCNPAVSNFLIINEEGKLSKLLPPATSFEYLVHSTFDAHNKHSGVMTQWMS